jgi:hypothetical protein
MRHPCGSGTKAALETTICNFYGIDIVANSETRQYPSLLAELQRKVLEARETILKKEEAACAEAAEFLETKRRVEIDLALRQRDALAVLRDWVDHFVGRNVFVHIHGEVICPPFKIEITVGLLNSPEPTERCLFRQVVRVRKCTSRRDVGIVFLPKRRFQVAEDLRDFLNDEFLTILSEPLVRCSRIYQMDPSKGAVANSDCFSNMDCHSSGGEALHGNPETASESESAFGVDDVDDGAEVEALSGEPSIPVPVDEICKGSYQVVYKRDLVKKDGDLVDCLYCGKEFMVDDLHYVVDMDRHRRFLPKMLGSLPQHITG